MGLTQQGVDAYYFAKAGQDNKSRSWLETPDQQLSFLAKMGEGKEDELINYTLRDMKRMPTLLKGLLDAWRSGDMQAMAELSISEFKQDYPDIYKTILLERNQNWLPEIEKMLTTKEREFVLVGALHLAGEDSVLKALTDKGYKVEKL